jgi:hypothetical protein
MIYILVCCSNVMINPIPDDLKMSTVVRLVLDLDLTEDCI